MKEQIQLKVNGNFYEIEVEPRETLLEVIREHLELTGARKSCEMGFCGACTVLLDGKAIHSCSVLAVGVKGREIITIEGLAEEGKLHPLQEAFIQYGAVQCGYCTPGMILSAKALLDENPCPTEDEVKAAISGNLCRCTGYVKIVKAIMAVGQKTKDEKKWKNI